LCVSYRHCFKTVKAVAAQICVQDQTGGLAGVDEMSIIYEPSGRAFEYSPLAANLYTGCSHRCKYCYAPSVVRKKRSVFHSDVKPKADILKRLEADCVKLQNRAVLSENRYALESRQILLCFTCDPYQPIENDITREALTILENHCMKAQILTKGGSRAIRDFDILLRNDWAFGTSLSFVDEKLRQQWEPGAATFIDRVNAICSAKDKGIHTWVSVEPVIDPTEVLEVMKMVKPWVDFWKVGKINHHKYIEDRIDWRKFLEDVKVELEGCDYYIKNDLAKYGDVK